jgi:hypothetical protein
MTSIKDIPGARVVHKVIIGVVAEKVGGHSRATLAGDVVDVLILSPMETSDGFAPPDGQGPDHDQ